MIDVKIRAYDMPAAAGWEAHAHPDEALLSFAVSGSCTQILATRTWLVLPSQAFWMPPGVEHATQIGPRGCSLRSVGVAVPLPAGLPREPCVIAVSPLMAELIARWEPDDQDAGRRAALQLLICDEIRRAPRLDHGLPRVRDPRLLRVVDRLQADPARTDDLSDWASVAGMSRRNFMRAFQVETGLGFAHWRRRLRILHARQLLADGASVTQTALSLGYQSPSAFIAMVRRELGVTPGALGLSHGRVT